MTRHKKPPKDAAERKAEQRERDAEEGIATYSARLQPGEAAMLKEVLQLRGGMDGPYPFVEYLATVVRHDHAALMGQMEDVHRYPCRQCGKRLPEGCGGVFKGELACLHTPTAWKLSIPVVPG